MTTLHGMIAVVPHGADGKHALPDPQPMVLAKSVGCVEAHCPGGKFSRDWLLYSIVGKGAFTVDSDRAKLGAHLLDIIAARKALALADSDLIYYRMLHAVTAHLLQGTAASLSLSRLMLGWQQ